MEIASTSNTSWTNSVFYGWIDTTWDALLILEAARKGVVPRVTRRFHDIEKRNMIRSGAVIVFTEEESGIKRWTDPYIWSASRMLGNFMIYREREDPRDVKTLPATYRSTLQKPKETPDGLDPELERRIYGSWRRGKGLKKDGLMKKTFSLIVDDATYHLISYYNPADVRSGTLRRPSSMAHISSLPIGPEFTSDQSQFRQPPADSTVPEDPPRAKSESNHSDSSINQARPSSDSYPRSPISTLVSSPTSPAGSSQWMASSYTGKDGLIPYSHPPLDGRQPQNLYGHGAVHPTYAPHMQQYDRTSITRSHSSNYDRNDVSIAAPLPHKPSHRPFEGLRRPDYEYMIPKSENNQS